MSYTFNSKIISAREGNSNAREEVTERLKSALYKCLDRQFNKPLANGRVPVSALVNLLGRQFLERNAAWQDKIFFYRLVAQQMREVLRDFVGDGGDRQANSQGQGDAFKNNDTSNGELSLLNFSVWDQSVQELTKIEEPLALILELYYMGGMSYEGIAGALSLSVAEVDKKLRFARAWVCRDMMAREAAN